MRYETQTVRIGENVGPVDWSHPMAKVMPPIWREAERSPEAFTFSEYRRTILALCMYDGWPYWEPTPAIQFIGPLNSAEWTFFNSYAVCPNSIQPRDSGRLPKGEDAQRLSGEAKPERPNEDSASPNLRENHHD